MTSLYRLIYFSRSLLTPTGSHTGLEDILRHSRRANHLSGLSGILLSSGHYFCQLLEGQLRPIELLFEAIQLDPRHTDITVMEFLPVPNRLFASWDMAYLDIDDAGRMDQQIETAIAALTANSHGRNIVRVFADLIVQRETFRS